MNPKPAGILYTPQGQRTYRYDGCTQFVVGKPRFPNDRALVVKCGDPKGSFLVGHLKEQRSKEDGALNAESDDQKSHFKNDAAPDGLVNNFLQSS